MALAAGTIASASAAAATTLPGPPTYEEIPARVEAVPWIPGPASRRRAQANESPAKGHTFTFSVQFPGGCAGEPRPEVNRITVVEKPKRGGLKASIITAYMLHPAHEEIVSPGEYGGVIYGACAGFGGASQTFRVKLKRPAERLTFFDGSSSPVVKRFDPGWTGYAPLRSP